MDELREAAEPPPIPLWLADRPIQNNLVVPWLSVQDADGRYHFGIDHAGRRLQALRGRLCGVCGRPHQERTVLLMRMSDVMRERTTQPGLHPQCFAYTRQACPMVAGKMSHYRSTRRDLGPGLVIGGDTAPGAMAEQWFAVWLSAYKVVVDAEAGRVFASYSGIKPLGVRQVSWWLRDALADIVGGA